MGKFIMELPVIIEVAENAGIDVLFVVPDLFKEGFDLRGNLVVLLDVVVSGDDEEVFYGISGDEYLDYYWELLVLFYNLVAKRFYSFAVHIFNAPFY